MPSDVYVYLSAGWDEMSVLRWAFVSQRVVLHAPLLTGGGALGGIIWNLNRLKTIESVLMKNKNKVNPLQELAKLNTFEEIEKFIKKNDLNLEEIKIFMEK